MEKSSSSPFRALEIMRTGFVLFDQDHTILYINPALASLFGYEPRELVGHNAIAMGDPRDRSFLAAKLGERQLGIDHPYSAQIRNRRGDPIHIHVRAASMVDAEGRYLGTLAVVSPTSTPKGAELQEAQLPEFASRIAKHARAIYSEALALHATQSPPCRGDQPAAHVQPHATPKPPARDLAPGMLSRRESEILRYLLEGMKCRAIAAAQHLSTHTVRNHVKAIYRKLGVHSQVELLRKLHR